MTHRKVYSQGCVPFSWEEKPGLPKFSHHKSSTHLDLSETHHNHIFSGDSFDLPEKGIKNILVPPPPCTESQPPRRSHSMKGLWWQDDPFLAALKACMKGVSRKHEGQIKPNGNESKGRNISKNMFSCKQSCDVENGNFVRLSSLPPLPRERYKAKPFVKYSQ